MILKFQQFNESKKSKSSKEDALEDARKDKKVHKKIGDHASKKGFGNPGINDIHLAHGGWDSKNAFYYYVRAGEAAYAVYGTKGDYIETAPSSFLQSKSEKVATYKN